MEGRAPELKITDEEFIKFNRYKFNNQELTRKPDEDQVITEDDRYLDYYPDGNDASLEYDVINVLKNRKLFFFEKLLK